MPAEPELDVESLTPPKRPLSSYMIFVQENQAAVMEQYPHIIHRTDITRKIAELWKELPNGQKEIYEDKAATAKAKYDAEYAEYCRKATEVVIPAKITLQPMKASEYKSESNDLFLSNI